MLPTVCASSDRTLPRSDPTGSNRDALSYEIVRLCRKEHKDSYVKGWEYDLWEAVMGTRRIPSVGFGDMNQLLVHARSADVWVSHDGNQYYFVPLSSWLAIAREHKEEKN